MTRSCLVPDCGSSHYAKGFCAKHYERFKKYGDPNVGEKKQKQVCSAAECSRFVTGHGYFQTHYQRWRKHGDPLKVAKVASYHGAECLVADCHQTSTLRMGYCQPHYFRWKKHGDPLISVKMRKPCSVQNCERLSALHGYCAKHHDRWKNNGDPLKVQKVSSYDGAECAVSNCNEMAYSSGYCRLHYVRFRQHGDPSITLHAVYRGQKCSEKDCAKVARSLGMCLSHYKESYPEIFRNISRRRRAKIRSAPSVSFTVEDLLLKVAYWGDKCWMCGGKYESIDHVKPLSKGGSHFLSNLRPACSSCNSKKRSKWTGVKNINSFVSTNADMT